MIRLAQNSRATNRLSENTSVVPILVLWPFLFQSFDRVKQINFGYIRIFSVISSLQVSHFSLKLSVVFCFKFRLKPKRLLYESEIFFRRNTPGNKILFLFCLYFSYPVSQRILLYRGSSSENDSVLVSSFLLGHFSRAVAYHHISYFQEASLLFIWK